MLVLKVEDLGVASGSRGDESGVKELEDFVADVGELRLDPSQKAPPKEIGWSFDWHRFYGDRSFDRRRWRLGFDCVDFVPMGF